MTMSKNLYIVPYDFTPVADQAVKYALFLAEKVHTEIKLLHLVPDKAKGHAIIQELDKACANFKAPEGASVTSLVKVGNIFTDIGKIAKEERAQLIIMGTHGMRGWQSIFGSHAMKVITSADCPFLIIQKETVIEEVRNIVVPIDLTKESLQITNLAGDMANILGAKLHVIAEKQTDEILNTRIQNRISIVKKQYEERNLDAGIAFVKKSGKYGRKVMSYVRENKINMIAIAYHSESLFPQFDSFAQRLITNKPAKPVLIINSKLASALYF